MLDLESSWNTTDISLLDVISVSRPALVSTLALYVLPLLVGSFGNAGIVYVIVSQKSLRTGVNAYIANMAVLDLLACLLLVPLRIGYHLDDKQVTKVGYILCQTEVKST